MRRAHPLTADENAVEMAVRQATRSHEKQDEALLRFRLANLKPRADRSIELHRVADLMLGVGA